MSEEKRLFDRLKAPTFEVDVGLVPVVLNELEGGGYIVKSYKGEDLNMRYDLLKPFHLRCGNEVIYFDEVFSHRDIVKMMIRNRSRIHD